MVDVVLVASIDEAGPINGAEFSVIADGDVAEPDKNFDVVLVADGEASVDEAGPINTADFSVISDDDVALDNEDVTNVDVVLGN